MTPCTSHGPCLTSPPHWASDSTRLCLWRLPRTHPTKYSSFIPTMGCQPIPGQHREFCSVPAPQQPANITFRLRSGYLRYARHPHPDAQYLLPSFYLPAAALGTTLRMCASSVTTLISIASSTAMAASRNCWKMRSMVHPTSAAQSKWWTHAIPARCPAGCQAPPGRRHMRQIGGLTCPAQACSR